MLRNKTRNTITCKYYERLSDSTCSNDCNTTSYKKTLRSGVGAFPGDGDTKRLRSKKNKTGRLFARGRLFKNEMTVRLPVDADVPREVRHTSARAANVRSTLFTHAYLYGSRRCVAKAVATRAWRLSAASFSTVLLPRRTSRNARRFAVCRFSCV